VLAVADAFDAMTSDRPYRPALDRDEAVAEVARCAGTQFDPEVVRVFLELFAEAAELPAAAVS
jgi:HD-GYP domain-containing protein (c-di-GMP phosphodiesterase class II)